MKSETFIRQIRASRGALASGRDRPEVSPPVRIVGYGTREGLARPYTYDGFKTTHVSKHPEGLYDVALVSMKDPRKFLQDALSALETTRRALTSPASYTSGDDEFAGRTIRNLKAALGSLNDGKE